MNLLAAGSARLSSLQLGPWQWLGWGLAAVLLQRAVWLEALHHPLWQSLLLVCALVLAGAAMAGRLLSGAWMGIAAYALVRVASAVKLSFVHEPLRASDLRDAQVDEALELFTHYWDLGLALVGCALAATVVVVWLNRRPGRWPAARRAVAALLALGGASAVVQATASSSLAASPQATSLLGFISSFHHEPPHLVSTLPPAPKAAQVQCPQHPPHVLSLLQESTYLPPALASQPGLQPFYQGNRWAGPLRVHVVGGMTHLSEFAYLTGFPHTALAGENSYPQVPLAGRIHGTLPAWFKACGYETTVLYATVAHFRNSMRWYTSLGFDHVLSASELGITPWRASDRLLYEKALAAVGSSDKPQFVFLSTIDRHGPYDRRDPVGDYRQRLRRGAADDAWLRQTLAAAARGGRPWVLGWFGDHRPARIDSEGPDRFTAWAVIDRPGEPAPAVEPAPMLDIAFFGDQLLREAGIVVQPLASRVAELRGRCAGDYMGCPVDLRDRHARDYIDIGGITGPGSAPAAAGGGAAPVPGPSAGPRP